MLGEQLLFLGNLLDSEAALGEALYLSIYVSVDRRRVPLRVLLRLVGLWL
jgi:hypothetical protein